jgi:hypothetical protein
MSNCLNSPLGTIVGVLAGTLPVWLVIWWLNRRARRRWEVQEQLREMEQAIWEESLPDWQREVIQEIRQCQAEVKCEARRRLGLPEEGP